MQEWQQHRGPRGRGALYIKDKKPANEFESETSNLLVADDGELRSNEAWTMDLQQQAKERLLRRKSRRRAARRPTGIECKRANKVRHLTGI